MDFTKVDGSKRRMRCTLREDLLPDREEVESKKKTPGTNQVVWDLDAKGWRSFRLDSVESYSKELVTE